MEGDSIARDLTARTIVETFTRASEGDRIRVWERDGCLGVEEM